MSECILDSDAKSKHTVLELLRGYHIPSTLYALSCLLPCNKMGSYFHIAAEKLRLRESEKLVCVGNRTSPKHGLQGLSQNFPVYTTAILCFLITFPRIRNY